MKKSNLTIVTIALSSYLLGSTASAETTVAPDFTLPSSAQRSNLRLAEQRGSNVVLFFWSTWCRDCVTAMRSIEKLPATMNKNGSPIVWSVALSNNSQQVTDAIESEDIGIPVLIAEESLAKKYAIEELPATVIVDRDGNIVRHREGASAYDVDLLHADLMELAE